MIWCHENQCYRFYFRIRILSVLVVIEANVIGFVIGNKPSCLELSLFICFGFFKQFLKDIQRTKNVDFLKNF